MDNEKLTVKWLKSHRACPEKIDFVKRNNLEGYPLNRVNEIEDDYTVWIKQILKSELKYDIYDNMIYKKDPDGNLYLYKYDSRNNLIYRKYPNGLEYFYEYDKNGNMIHKWEPIDKIGYTCEYEYDILGRISCKKDSYGEIYHNYDDNGNLIYFGHIDGAGVYSDYDSHGNLIYEKYPSGDQYYFRHDDNGNPIYKKGPNGEFHMSSVIINGRLKSYGDLVIPIDW